MRLPRYISPDRIKDSLVEINYQSKLPFEVLLGIFFESLDDTYTYTNRPFNIPGLEYDKSNPIPFAFKGNSLFHNDKIKFEIRQNSIMFNCLENYLGWDKYFEEISKVLIQLNNSNKIDHYNRVGMRYISQYPEYDIQKITKYQFTFGMPDIKSENFNFRSEFSIKEFLVILNLESDLTIFNPRENFKSKISTIDVDVSRIFSPVGIEELLAIISEIHTKEKEVFFSILNEEFLEELKPVY